MQRRLEMLKRLVTLYGVIEEMHSVELQRRIEGVREVQRASGVQEQAGQAARSEARNALMAGDRMGWTMAETQRESAGWRRLRLEQICLEREVLSEAAREQFVESRVKSEQMRRVAEDIATLAEIEEGRRAQGVSDDRFLARRRWSDARDRLQKDGQMNVS